MRDVTVSTIVEGHGEVTAVPVLLRRLFEETGLPNQGVRLALPPPFRMQRSKIGKGERDFRRAVDFAARKAGPEGGIVVFLDADADCPAELGPRLLGAACEARPDRPVVVVVAKSEFEAWFLAAARSLRGHRGIAQNASPPDDPESARGAKERLKALLEEGATYLETTDQAAFTAQLDLNEACAAPSFARCRKRITELFEHVADAARSADARTDDPPSGKTG